MSDHDPTTYSVTRARWRNGPSWRWLTAQQAASQPGKVVGRHDALTKLAIDYLRGRVGRRQRAAQLSFRLVEAAEIIDADGGVRETLQILAVGDVDVADMAETSGIAQDEIRTWEGLYFDVRECRSRFAWIRAKIIHPLEEAGRTTFAARLKVALVGGASAAEAVIESDVRMPAEEADRILDANRKIHQKLMEAGDIPLTNSAEALQLMSLYQEQQQLEFEREKFREHCATERRRHELAVKRLEHPELVAEELRAQVASES